MPHSAGFGHYRAVFAVAGVRGPVLAALFGRLPIAMVGLSMLFYVQREVGSFAVAGAASAGPLAGIAVGSIVQGRAMDRLGPSRPLLVGAGWFAVFVVASVYAIEAHAATVILVAAAFGVGLGQPAIGSASRAMWTRLTVVGPVRNAAMAYEAITTEVYFILGPALVGVLLSAPWAGAGLIVGAVSMVLGTVWYALTPTVRAVRSAHDAGGEHRRPGLLGGLASPGMRTVGLAALAMGMLIGVVEVAVPAAATRAGSAPTGGLLLGLWSVSSAACGVVFGLRQWKVSTRMLLFVLLGGFSILVALLAIPSSLVGLGLLLLLAGTLIAPQATAHALAVHLAAPHGTTTEAFSWVVTASTLGIAVGQASSGLAVEHAGVDVAYVGGGLLGLGLAAVISLRRGTLTEGGPDPVRPDPAGISKATISRPVKMKELA